MKKASDKLKNNYIVIQSWMVRELGLKGNSAIIYALIYGFSQAEGQVCTCGDDYMAAWINGTPRAVINIKNNLLLAGLIEKVDGIDGDKRFSGYRVVQSKIGEKSSSKSLPTVNKTYEESSPIASKTCEKSSPKSGQKYVKKFPKIGEDFSPNNKLYTQTDKSVCQSTRAHAREGGTDGQAEKEFYLDCIRSHLDKLDDPYKEDYSERLESIITELALWSKVKVNGVYVPATEILKSILNLFRDPEQLRNALFAGCKSGIKRKFNYTVAALYNAAKQF